MQVKKNNNFVFTFACVKSKKNNSNYTLFFFYLIIPLNSLY